jgi:hypothetical protein
MHGEKLKISGMIAKRETLLLAAQLLEWQVPLEHQLVVYYSV